MKICWQRESSTRLTCSFKSGRLDGNVPLESVFVEGPHLDRITDQRLALIGYFMVREIISNTIDFDGITVAPFAAAAFLDDFDGAELFISPLEQADRYIVHPHREKLKQAFGANTKFADVHVEQTKFGFTLRKSSEQVDFEYFTNIPFFLTMSSIAPEKFYRKIKAALIFDLMNANTLVATRSEALGCDLLVHLGFAWEFHDE